MNMKDFQERLKNTTHPTIMIHSIESIEIEVEERGEASKAPILEIEFQTINGDSGSIILFFNKGEHIKKNIHNEVSKVQKMPKLKKFISNIIRKYSTSYLKKK